jgi:hemolysin activation/secretion protein
VHSSGIDELSASYAFPLTPKDTTLRVRYEGTRSKIVERPFNVLDITSESTTVGVDLTHPFIRTPDEDFVLGLTYENRKSNSYLLGQPFSFSLGPDDGESKVSVIRFSQLWNKRMLNTAVSVRSVFSFGIDANDSTIYGTNPPVTACGPDIKGSDCPDSDFISWLGQLQYAHRFAAWERTMNFIFRADAQLASEPLLPLEKFSLGGVHTVRGYRENQLVSDNAVVLSAEMRIPLKKTEAGASTITFVPFYDYGYAWDKVYDTPMPDSISSIGLGVLWNPDRHFHAELFVAKAFRKIVGESDDHNLQDSGIHFQLSYRMF